MFERLPILDRICLYAMLAVLWLALLFGSVGAMQAFGAQPVAKPQPVAAAPADEAPIADLTPSPEDQEAFRRLRKPDDEGLEKILDKKFELPQPDIFTGWKMFKWGLAIAGTILGVFFAIVIVVFTIRILRKYIAPSVTGIPDATPAILQLFDNLQQKIENKAKALEAEKLEIEKRLKKDEK